MYEKRDFDMEDLEIERWVEKYNLNTQMIKLPMKIKAAVTKNEDDSYTIFINKNLPIEVQRQAFLHELNHIRFSNFESEESADEIETRNHARDIDYK